jgi:hypothetical protein
VELLATRAEPQGEAELLLAAVDSVAAFGELLAGADWSTQVPGRGGFGLLLVWDGDPPEFADMAALARELIGSGMFYFGAWGQDCARVEYAVDIADVMLSLDAEPAEGSDEAPIVMTSAFPDLPVADALFQLWEMAPRDDGKPWGPARVVVALSTSPELETAVRDAVSAPGGAG